MLAFGLVVVAARPVAADRALEVALVGDAPFAAGELTSALRMRVPVEGAAIAVQVTPSAAGVRIEIGGRSREVILGGLRGPAAARLVALAASDLVLDDPMAPTVTPTASEPSATFGVLGGATGWQRALGGIGFDLALPVHGALATFEAGGGTISDHGVAGVVGTLRVGAGTRSAWLEARGGLTLVPLVVTSGVGDRTVLVGAGVSLRARLPITSGVRGLLAGGVDAFATHTEYRIDGMSAMVTPRWAPWGALGIELEL